jgi:hypothetical protein
MGGGRATPIRLRDPERFAWIGACISDGLENAGSSLSEPKPLLVLGLGVHWEKLVSAA